MGFGFGSTEFDSGLGTNGFEVSLNYLTGVPNPNILASSDLQLCFKGLQKRDSTTREKSIGNLCKLITNEPTQIDDDLVVMSWCQMYAKLAIDDSKRVRSGAHDVQSKFVLILGRKYAKYLKDTIGIWLAGLFDIDRSAAKACKVSIHEAFGNDVKKVGNLWKIYINQILNYSLQVFAVEDKDTLSDERFVDRDESQAKYEGVLLGATLLFVQMLNKLKEEDIQVREKTSDLILKILQEDRFEKLFSIPDPYIKKAMYQMVRVLMTTKQASRLVGDQLFQRISASAIDGLKLSKKQVVNPIVYSGAVISMLDALVVLTKYDESIWISVKQSQESLLSILQLGSLNSNPVYYEVLSSLLSLLPPFESAFKNIDPYMKILAKDVATEKHPDFQLRAWKCYLKFALTFVSHLDEKYADAILRTLTAQVVKALDSPRPLSKPILTEFAQLPKFSSDNADVLVDINSGILDSLPNGEPAYPDLNVSITHEKQFSENFVSVLIASKSDLLEVLLASAVDSLEDEIGGEVPTLSLCIIDIYIRQNLILFKSAVKDFIAKLPNYFSSENIDQPLKVLVDYSNSKFSTSGEISSITNTIFLKLRDSQKEDSIIRIISHIKDFSIEHAPDLRKFLLERSKGHQGEEADNEDSFFKFLTPKILSNMYENADTSEKLDHFVSGCLKYYQDEPILKFASETPEFLKFLFQSLDDNDETVKLLSKLELHMQNEEFKSSCFKALISSLESESVTSGLLARTKDFDLPTWEEYLPDDLLLQFQNDIPQSPDTRMAISNSFGTGLFLFVSSALTDHSSNIDTALPSLMRKCHLYNYILNEYPELAKKKQALAVQLAVVGQMASDYVFLMNSPSQSIEATSSSLQNDSLELVRPLFATLSSSELLLAESSTSDAAEHVFRMLENDNLYIRYYYYRLYQQLLLETSEKEKSDGQSFGYIDKISGNPEKVFTFLNCHNDLLVSDQLFKLRNGTAAGLSGVRSSKDITTKGLQGIILLNKLIDLDVDYEIPEGLELFPAQRFMMTLNSLSNWPDCDAAYNPEFNPVRLALLEFVHNYIKGIYYVCDSNYPSSFIEKVFELGVRLCLESLNVINAGDGTLELTYYTLKTWRLLYHYKDQIESWDDDKDDMEDELVDLLFRQLESKEDNRANYLVNEIWPRIFFDSVPARKLLPQYERLYPLIDSESTEIQRIAVYLLCKLIPTVQDTLVVEATLDKKRLELAELPPVLLKYVTVSNAIEYEEETKVNRFLWSWYLILNHFEGITQQIREKYIYQLGDNVIADFLTYLVRDIDVMRFKVPLASDPTYVSDYSVIDDHSSLEPEDELKKILVNLLYMMMRQVGGSTIQTWYSSIRDKQLKQSTDTFVTKFISPPLIEDVLESLSNKGKIEDENFKIKVNRAINEIKCMCEIDDQTMEISVVLPINFPLSQISVNGVSRVGVDEKKWKSWLLSCQYVINFQNVSILDAVKHFKENVESNFENFDDCAICYSIINAVDHSTPNKVCPTCHHNFHSACLYRWFKSSGSSTCPLCRSKFSFKTHN
ncbi:DEKNAAC101678 [Brettanomyces naardenensis]|uniref:E3 ubiquitin-protein ligase listerin n=1 Tax=Brettanomyces naardenensis TaxID=13370 RepID=A0A448YIR1_BRENA|nr:DEKNAAC101678 [Brettanomyces naardenensis]